MAVAWNFRGSLISQIADSSRLTGTNFREFRFQILPLGTHFRRSWTSSRSTFHVRYFYIISRGFDIFILLTNQGYGIDRFYDAVIRKDFIEVQLISRKRVNFREYFFSCWSLFSRNVIFVDLREIRSRENFMPHSKQLYTYTYSLL